MADGDQRIEVLEDEMKVLKREVSRTLVDLRVLLMREDSPLMTGGLLKRVAAGNDQPVATATQINLVPASEPVAAVTITTVEQDLPTIAGLPSMGSINMPEAPGTTNETPLPSQGNAVSIPSGAASIDDISVPPSAHSMDDISVPPSAHSMDDISVPPSAPSMDDISVPPGQKERRLKGRLSFCRSPAVWPSPPKG